MYFIILNQNLKNIKFPRFIKNQHQDILFYDETKMHSSDYFHSILRQSRKDSDYSSIFNYIPIRKE